MDEVRLRRLLNNWIGNDCDHVFEAYEPLWAGQHEAMQAFVNIISPRLRRLSPSLFLAFDRDNAWGSGRLVLTNESGVTTIMELKWNDEVLTAVGAWTETLTRSGKGAARRMGARLIDFVVGAAFATEANSKTLACYQQ